MERRVSIGEVLRSALSSLAAALVQLDVDVLDGASAVALLKDVAVGEAGLAACRTLLARRVETSNAHLLTGCSSASQVIASVSGVSQRDAAQTLETARRLEDLPDTEARFRSGELSASQVQHVARAAEVDPSSEARLLALAQRDSVRSLSDEARRVVAAGCEDAAEAAHRKRYLRISRVGEHSVELHGRFATSDFMWVDAVLQPLAKRAFMEARSSGRRDGSGAYLADGLVEMAKLAAGAGGSVGSGNASGSGGGDASASGGGGGDASAGAAGKSGGRSKRATPPGRIKTTVNVVVDHSVLVRGSVEPGERCEVVGLGPLPVSTVNHLLEDCFLRVLVTNGRDVVAMGTEDRYLPSGVRAALALRDRVCSVRNCDTTVGLEIDHFHEVRHGGRSTQENLAFLCAWHHRGKSLGRFRLDGPVGDYVVVYEPEGNDSRRKDSEAGEGTDDPDGSAERKGEPGSGSLFGDTG